MTKLGGPNLDWEIRESFSQELPSKLRLEEQMGIIPQVEEKRLLSLNDNWKWSHESSWMRKGWDHVNILYVSSGQWKMINEMAWH